MSFLDELSKTISDVGQSTIKKGKDLAEVTKWTVALHDEEKKEADLFREIGSLYVQLYADAPGEEFAPLLETLKAQQEKIEACKKKLRALKGVAVCDECGAEVTKEASFCPSCGSPIEKEEPVEAEVAEEEVTEEACCAEEAVAEEPCCAEEAVAEEPCCAEEACEETCCTEETCCEETPCCCGEQTDESDK